MNPDRNPYAPATQSPWGQTGNMEHASRTEMAARFTSRMFGWMAGGLALSGVVAMTVLSNETLLAGVAEWFRALLILELAMVIGFSALLKRMNFATAAASFLAYAAVNGLTLGLIVTLYTRESVANTFFVTAGTFGAMAVVGATTKRDLTSMGSFLMMGVVALIIAGVVNIFMHSSALQFAISSLGALIFTGLTAYDVQRFQQLGYMGFHTSEEEGKVALVGALNLYLDFVNLFLMLLRLFGGRRN